MPYQGRQPGIGVRRTYIYTAAANQTTFSGADDNARTLAYEDGSYVDCYLNGIMLVPTDDFRATTKTSVTLVQGASTGDVVEIICYDIASIADTVSKSKGGSFGSDVLNVDLTNDRVGINHSNPTHSLDAKGTSRIGHNVDQDEPSATDLGSTSHVILGGKGGNGIYIGQYEGSHDSPHASWMQSAFNVPNTAKYDIVMQPLGGDVGIQTDNPSAPLHVNKGTNASSAFPSGNWAAKIFNETDLATEGGLVVANRYAANSSTAFLVGNLFDAGDGFDDLMKISGLGLVTTPKQTAFLARRGSSQTGFGSTAKKIEMNGETYDNSGSYDHTTNYRFTAPVTGTYLFNASILWEKKDATRIDLHFYVNGSAYVAHEFQGLSSGYFNYSTNISAMIRLSANDYVELYGQKVGGTTDASVYSESKFNHFSGFLLG
jgi:hypothetical protein